MKIAQIVSSFPPYRGGMGNVAFCIADHLSRLKYDVTVFTPMRSLTDSNFKSFFKIHHLIPQIRYGNAAIVSQLFFRCFKYEVVHLHYPFIGSSLAMILLKFFRRKRVNFILHYQMDLVGKGWRRIVFKVYSRVFLKRLIKSADTVIVTSFDYAKESLIASYLKKYPDKFVEVANGVDINTFLPQPKSRLLIREYDLKDEKIILFVGALDHSHYFKGINYLIKAFQLIKCKNTKLIIVGEGDLKQVYQDLVDSYGFRDRVIFTGYIPDTQLVDYYNLCDILVLPSIDKSEAFGMVLLEAMSCAKPVVASDLPGVRKVVDRKVNGRLAKPKDVKSLTNQLDFLLENKTERERYGLAGRKKVEENYSWASVVKQIINLY